MSRHSPVASTFQSRLDQHDDDIHVKVERLEANLRDLERKQKKDSKKIEINQNNVTQLEAHLASIRKTLKTSKDSEIEYDSSGGARGSHSKHLFSRDPSENKKIFSPTSSYESKVDGLIADATNTKQKTKIYRTNTTKACRSLFQGLVDVQHATLELIGWTDQVQTAFGILSEKFFLMTNVCPGFKSTFRIDDRAYCTIPILDYDT